MNLPHPTTLIIVAISLLIGGLLCIIWLLIKKLNTSQERYLKLNNQYTQLETMLTQKEHSFQEQIKLINDNKNQLKLEFEQLANHIFDRKNAVFTQQSNLSLQTLLTPFKDQVADFKKKVEDIHYKESLQKNQLINELHHLKTLNQQITQETHELTTALKGNKKMQGNWGELILENVLERAGLQANKDFKLQASLTSEMGDIQRPDVLIYLPEQKHLIVDSKVSLNAYTRAVNADTEEEQQTALKEHNLAIENHIKTLSKRYYHQSSDINSPEIVIMFIPIEAAFVEAFKANDTLFQQAVDKQILIATPTTLLTSLNIIKQLWRLEHQTQHTVELTHMASKIHDKLRTFLSSMDEIETSLTKAQYAYLKAKGQLLDGKGNLVKLVDDFQKLGVSVKNELPNNWKEKANLELNNKP